MNNWLDFGKIYHKKRTPYWKLPNSSPAIGGNNEKNRRVSLKYIEGRIYQRTSWKKVFWLVLIFWNWLNVKNSTRFYRKKTTSTESSNKRERTFSWKYRSKKHIQYIAEIIQNFQKLCLNMSIKILFLHSHIDFIRMICESSVISMKSVFIKEYEVRGRFLWVNEKNSYFWFFL